MPYSSEAVPPSNGTNEILVIAGLVSIDLDIPTIGDMTLNAGYIFC